MDRILARDPDGTNRYNIGGFFGPWILGYVRQRSGASAALYICALVVLIAPTLVAYLRFTNKQMPWK